MDANSGNSIGLGYIYGFGGISSLTALYVDLSCGVFGGLLSFYMLTKEILGQNEWISSLHWTGFIMEAEIFPIIFLITSAALSSGLSLGPELPLVLTGGMAGSCLANWNFLRLWLYFG